MKLDSILPYMILAVCILGLTYVVVATIQIILIAIQYKRHKQQISKYKGEMEQQWERYNKKNKKAGKMYE